MDSPDKPQTNGYGKRPLWQWIILYIVLAIIVYGLIYLIFFYHQASSASNSYY